MKYVRYILIILLFSISGYLLYHYIADIISYFFISATPTGLPPPPPPPPGSIGIEAGPVKMHIDDDTHWESVAKALVTVLGTYAGVKIINKVVK